MRVHAALGEAAPQASPGLVNKSTTHTVGSVFEFDPVAQRAKRLQINVTIAASCHDAETRGKPIRACMVTLTYAKDDGWHASHIRNYLTAVRNWHRRLTAGNTPLRYVWTAEIQPKRGVIHYHVIFWLAKGITMPKADKRGWWPHGMTNTLKARNAVGYLVSYAKKLATKEGLPRGARIYGVGGLARASRDMRRWINWPEFVQARFAISDPVGPAKGGGWVHRVSGEWWPSEYGLSFAGKTRVGVVRLHDHGRPMGDCGPFSWIKNTAGVAAAA